MKRFVHFLMLFGIWLLALCYPLALRLFLLGLLLRPIGPWWVRGPLLALCAVC